MKYNEMIHEIMKFIHENDSMKNQNIKNNTNA